MVPKLLVIVALEWIKDIRANFHCHMANFNFRWRFEGVESNDVCVGVNKSVIFSYWYSIYIRYLLLFRLTFISTMEQVDRSLTISRRMVRSPGLCGYALIFILWRVVIFNSTLAYFFFITSTIRLLLWVFTVLGATSTEWNLSIARGKSFIIGFSSSWLKFEF